MKPIAFVTILYGIISGLGFLNRGVGAPYFCLIIFFVAAYYVAYASFRKIYFSHTCIAGMVANLAVQLTGGIESSLFMLYFLALPVMSFKDEPRNYWIVAPALVVIELSSGLVVHRFQVLPILCLAIAVVIIGYIIESLNRREHRTAKALLKYESRDGFLAPAGFGSDKIVTSVEEVDRHKAIERPLLYFVKFLHHVFDAHTTAVFACDEKRVVLVQGFSHSELFVPETVVDSSLGLYRQVITERRPILIKDYVQNPDELGYYRGAVQIKSVMMAPITLIDEVVGVLVTDRKSDAFQDRDKAIFDEAATTAGFLLAMLRLYEKARYDVRHLASIADLAEKLHKRLDLREILSDAIQAFKRFMPCDDISIAKIDEINSSGEVIVSTYAEEKTTFSLNDGLVGFVARHKNSIIKDDLSKGNLIAFKKGVKTANASFVAVPIQQDDELLGVLWLEHHQPKKYNDDDVRILNILSYQLSLAWQRAILYDKVKELSIRDGLTDLYNHRHFQEILEEEINEVDQLVLVLLDIDHFKAINDTYGHQAGDKVLTFLGRVISQAGIAARYGGEEFAIIMPGCSLKKGMDRVVRMKDQLLKSEVSFDQAKIRFTVSIGIAHYPEDAETRVLLIEQADRALYTAKEQGRDRIIIAQSLTRQ